MSSGALHARSLALAVGACAAIAATYYVVKSPRAPDKTSKPNEQGTPNMAMSTALSDTVVQRYHKLVVDVFDAADTNKDGKVDQNEAFQLVLQMYIQINRQAPIEPPSKELVDRMFKAADKDKSGYVSKEEFCELAGPLCARSFSRVAVYKFVNTVGAPVFAVAGEHLISKLVDQTAAKELIKKIIPEGLHAAVINSENVRLILGILFCSTLGSKLITGIDSYLGFKERKVRKHCSVEQACNADDRDE